MEPDKINSDGATDKEHTNNVVQPKTTPLVNETENVSITQPQESQPISQTQLNQQPGQPDTTITQPQVIQQPIAVSSQPLNAPQVSPQQAFVPSLNNAYLDKSAPGITFGVWSIITSFIPIVGFILGLVAVIKGFGGDHKNKILGILGIVGVLLSIGFFIFSILLILAIEKPTYGELETKSGTLSGQYTDSGFYDYSFKYPKDFSMVEVPLRNVSAFEHVNDLTDKSISKIILVIEEMEPGYDKKFFETDFGKVLIGDLIEDTIGTEKDSTTFTLIDTGYNALFGDAVLFEFTSIAPDGIEIQGSLVFVYNQADETGYSFFLGSHKDVWNENLDVFTEIRNSLNNK